MSLRNEDLRLRVEYLINRMNSVKDDFEVVMALDNFLIYLGYEVAVSRFTQDAFNSGSGRQFLVTFGTHAQAVDFANNIGRPTFGYNNVLLKLD